MSYEYDRWLWTHPDDDDTVHPEQGTYDKAMGCFWRKVYEGRSKEVCDFIDKQINSLVGVCDDAGQFSKIASEIFDIVVDDDVAEMLFEGEKDWLARRWPEPDFS